MSAAGGLTLATLAPWSITPGRYRIQLSTSRSKNSKYEAQAPIAIYTILADDEPVAALESSGPEARELLKERWLLQELTALKVDGEPIYKPATRLRVRPATEEKWAIYDQESKTAEPGEEILFVYLVDLDP